MNVTQVCVWRRVCSHQGFHKGVFTLTVVTVEHAVPVTQQRTTLQKQLHAVVSQIATVLQLAQVRLTLRQFAVRVRSHVSDPLHYKIRMEKSANGADFAVDFTLQKNPQQHPQQLVQILQCGF